MSTRNEGQMKIVKTSEYETTQKSDPTETLKSVSNLVETAQAKADAADLKFIGYLLNMARMAIREELSRGTDNPT